jgi:hypothetical protein
VERKRDKNKETEEWGKEGERDERDVEMDVAQWSR